MQQGHIKNWAEFQHYKDRSPPWIKLHRALLDDFQFTSLPLASKALAPLLWLLAAESKDGAVSIEAEWLAWRLRIDVSDVAAGLSPLIERGFVIVASKSLAKRKQVAPESCSEGEGEGETEGEASASKRAGKKPKAPEVPIVDWIAALDGGDAVAADDPLFVWAQQAGIPREWIALAWWSFEARYTDNPKRYADALQPEGAHRRRRLAG